MRIADLEGRATLTVPEAAELLMVSSKSAYEAAKRGEIPTLTLGRRILVPVPKLLVMLGFDASDGEAG